MVNALKNRNGFSIVELLVSSAVGGLVVAGLASGVGALVRIQSQMGVKHQIQVDALSAASAIIKVGRLAVGCSRVAPSSLTPEWLQCQVDTNFPATATVADDTTYRFGIVNGRLEWQRLQAGTYVTQFVFTTISQFSVCDDSLMAAGYCPIPGTGISTAHAQDVTASGAEPNRFFRFSLVAQIGSKAVSRQGAFMVRHPLPNGMRYQWGLTDTTLAGGP